MTMTTAMPRRKRRVWPFVVIGVIILAVAAWFIAEPALRTMVEDKIREKIRTALELDDAHPVHVEVPGVIIPQLISGKFDTVHAAADNVTYGGVTGNIWGTAHDISFNGDASDFEGSLSFSAEQIKRLLPTDFFDWTTVDIEEPSIAFGGGVEVVGVKVPLKLWMTPGAKNGDLLLTPDRFTVAGAAVTADNIVDTFGKEAEQYVKAQSICIRMFIPKGVTLEDMRIDGNRIVATASVDPKMLKDKSLQENGTCF